MASGLTEVEVNKVVQDYVFDNFKEEDDAKLKRNQLLQLLALFGKRDLPSEDKEKTDISLVASCQSSLELTQAKKRCNLKGQRAWQWRKRWLRDPQQIYRKGKKTTPVKTSPKVNSQQKDDSIPRAPPWREFPTDEVPRRSLGYSDQQQRLRQRNIWMENSKQVVSNPGKLLFCASSRETTRSIMKKTTKTKEKSDPESGEDINKLSAFVDDFKDNKYDSDREVAY